MILFKFIILFSAPMLGGLAGLYAGNLNQHKLKIFMAFSGAFLLSTSFVTLIPEVYHSLTPFKAGLYILTGFFLQLIFEQFSGGVEHGHIHIHNNQHNNNVPWLIFMSLSAHSFMEGIPQGSLNFNTEFTSEGLLIGTALHEIPASFALMTVFIHHIKSFRKCIPFLITYSLMGPVAMSTSFIVQEKISSIDLHGEILALVVGFFLHISTTILFENSENHLYNRMKLMAIAAGILLCLLTQYR